MYEQILARPVADVQHMVHCYGDLYGVAVSIDLHPDQKWRVVSKSNSYIFLRRKGGVTLRLTPTAFDRLFEFIEKTT